MSRLLPGLLLCCLTTGLAFVLQVAEERLVGQPYVEALVLAILLGVAIRTVWTPPERFRPGIEVSAKLLLEIAVMLLGASVSVQAVLAIGPAMILGIAAVVVVAIAASFGICRALGLETRMSILIACGNSICGNSAIAAVAPVIGADGDDVASSIAFTLHRGTWRRSRSAPAAARPGAITEHSAIWRTCWLDGLCRAACARGDTADRCVGEPGRHGR